MFNDERINFEMSNLKKLIIIFSLIISIIFLSIKLVYKSYSDLNFCLYSPEIVIVISSVIILLGQLFLKTEIKDEMYYKRYEKYYNLSFKIFIYINFLFFALMIPSIIVTNNDSVFSPNVSINLIMTSSLFIGYGYLRSKKIYFNYNIIEDDRNTYYKNVLKNILEIIKFFSIIYGVALIVSVFYMFNNSPLTFIVSIIISYLVAIIQNGIYYLFISFLERLYFNEEEKKRRTTSTIILISITGVVFVLFTLMGLLYTIISHGKINEEVVKTLTVYSVLNKDFHELYLFFSVLGCVFLFSDITKDSNNKHNKYMTFVYFYIIFTIIQLLILKTNTLFNKILIDIIENITEYSSINFMVVKINLTIYFVLSLISLILIKINLSNTKKVNALFVSFIIVNILSYIGGIIQNVYMIYIFTYFLKVVLMCISFLFIICYYKKSSNNLNKVIE